MWRWDWRRRVEEVMDFINGKLDKLPVVAVVYSHSHADH